MTAEPQSSGLWGPQSPHQPGMPPQSHLPHGMPPQAYPPYGATPLYYPPHGAPQQAYPPPGMPYPPPVPQAGYAAPGYPQANQPAPVPGAGYIPSPYAHGLPHQQLRPVPRLPGVVGVIVATSFLGAFGAFFAASRARRAASFGLSGRKYWIAFAATLAALMTLGIISMVVDENTRVVMTPASLENAIVTESDFRNSDGTAAIVEAANCSAAKVDDDGTGIYRCLIGFEGGDSVSYQVTVDRHGNWVTDDGD